MLNICVLSTLLTISSAFLSQRNTHIARFAIPTQQSPSFASALAPATATAPQRFILQAASVSEGGSAPLAESDDDDDDDDDEWELEEFEYLEEQDFYGSEWKVGTVMDGKNKIDETWCRLVVKEDGKFEAYWGDNSQGTWKFDPASQFLSISKDSFGGWLGKKIWAGTVEDYYFVEGSVRGWSPISAAAVIGQWQSKRLGVDPEEAGIAPWFETDDEDKDKDEEKEDSADGKVKSESPVASKKEEPKESSDEESKEEKK